MSNSTTAIFEMDCAWCPHSTVIRIREKYPPSIGGNKTAGSKKLISEHARYDENIKKELIGHARVHIRYMKLREPGKTHDSAITDTEILNKWIYKVVHLPESPMP